MKKTNRMGMEMPYCLKLQRTLKFTLLIFMASVFQLHSKNALKKIISDKEIELKVEQKNVQGIKITGKITDISGIPITSVSILEKGTKNFADTDFDGNYSIVVHNKEAILVFSFVGFKTQEISIGKDTKINVTLLEDTSKLDEVVVVGYGTKKKYTVVSSVSTVEPEELQNSSQRSLSNNLAGRLTGVIGVQRKGEMGFDNADIFIRGMSSFMGSNQPLILVDGVERSLNQMDPAEIATFTVLKDASASAIYGVRGGNGVIIITTKRGKVGKPQASIHYEHSTTQPTQLPEFLGAADYMEVMNSINTERGVTPIYTREKIANTRAGIDPDLNADVNWLDAVTKDVGSNDRINFNVSGGTELLRYAMVASYYGEKGIMEVDPKQEWDASPRLNRFNLRSNIDLNFTPSTLFRVSIGGYLQNYVRSPVSVTDLLGFAFETPPNVHPTQYSTGQIPKLQSRQNPWALATQRGYERVSESKLESLFVIEQNLNSVLNGLKATLKFSFDKFSKGAVQRGKEPEYYAPASTRNTAGELVLGVPTVGSKFLGYSLLPEFGNNATYLETNIEYSKNLGSNHHVDGLFLYNQREYDDGKSLTFRNQGIAGRFSYQFKKRYIAEFNFGYNGSENFEKGMRMGFFPSYSLGWIVSEEPFMEGIQSTVSNLKLRASYGLVGNDAIGPSDNKKRFPYVATIGNTDNYRWGVNNDWSRDGRWEGDAAVTDLTWETIAKNNIGFDLGLWNAVNLIVDVFKERREDIFMQRATIPGSAGFTSTPWANYGSVENKGLEVALDVNKKFSKDFSLKVFGNFTYAHNTITQRDEAETIVGTSRAETGKPVGQLFGYIADGLFKQEDFDPATGKIKAELTQQNLGVVRPGDIKYKDLNGDGIISPLDKTAIGGPYVPEIVYGAGLSLKYKSFDFALFFQGNAKTHKIIGQGASFFLPGSGSGSTGNIYSNADDRWTVDNPRQDVFWPRLTYGPSTNNSESSTWWLRDMSMLRLKDIEIGYVIPDTATKQIGINMLRLYIRGNNLLTWSKFKLWDPEVDSNTGFRYPNMKALTLGLDLNF